MVSWSIKYSIRLRTGTFHEIRLSLDLILLPSLFYVEHFVHRFLPRPHLVVIFNSTYDGRKYINLPNGDAQVEQLDGIAATPVNVCGVVTTWIGKIHCK